MPVMGKDAKSCMARFSALEVKPYFQTERMKYHLCYTGANLRRILPDMLA
jgi:hypothetical protein